MNISSIMNVQYRCVFLLLIFFLDINSLPYRKENPLSAKGAWAYSTEIHLQCFSADSLVRLSNGKEKLISTLRRGDEILTIDQTNIVSTDMILMLDQQISKQVFFYTLKSKSGYQLSLTKYHLIPIKSLNKTFNYLFAKQIQIGDLLYILNNNNQIEYSPVINITIERKLGYYAPLTMKGTLLVNQILSSCFANTNNHHLAQTFMFPFRFHYQLQKYFHLNHSFSNEKSEGLHWIISILFHLIHYFRPQTFLLS